MTDIRPLETADYGAGARVITDALLDDPGWLAVGPDRRNHRRVVALRYHRTALKVMHRYGGPVYGAFGGTRELAGVASTFGAGRYPPPAWTFLTYVPGFLLAGPAPVVRGLRTSAVQDRGHPQGEHVFLWFLAVDPAHQRMGVYSRTQKRPSISTRPTRRTCPTTRASASRSSTARPSRAAPRCGS